MDGQRAGWQEACTVTDLPGFCQIWRILVDWRGIRFAAHSNDPQCGAYDYILPGR